MTIRYMFRIELLKFQILIHFTDYIAHGFDSCVPQLHPCDGEYFPKIIERENTTQRENKR